jgi:hypothetical protein
MSIQLEIQDGSPWYLSPDIWTVPGSDPTGAPGTPIVGEPCYMWARVHNNGSTQANNAQVRFYWANPSVGFDRNTANLIGTANVSLAPGEVREVLCLTPWVPVYVNGGHECVLAEAFHPTGDPLPASPVFNVPTDRHVAQRNLSVVYAFKLNGGMFSASFSVCNSSRKDQTFRIFAKPGRLEELKPLVKQLGRDVPLQAAGELKNVGFAMDPCPDERAMKEAVPVIERFTVKGKVCSGLTLVGQLEGDAALIHVIQEADGKEVGGLSVLVLNGDRFKPQEHTPEQHEQKTPKNRRAN